jgi:hypothetical protein
VGGLFVPATGAESIELHFPFPFVAVTKTWLFIANDIAAYRSHELNWFYDKYWHSQGLTCSGDPSSPLEWAENRIGVHETVEALPEALEIPGPAQLITGASELSAPGTYPFCRRFHSLSSHI